MTLLASVMMLLTSKTAVSSLLTSFIAVVLPSVENSMLDRVASGRVARVSLPLDTDSLRPASQYC